MTSRPDETAEVQTGIDRLRRAIRPVMAVAALVFVVWAFKDLVRRWDGHAVHLAWGWVCASLLPLLVGGTLLAVAWKYLVERMAGTRVAFGASMALYVESQLARYIPGKVGIPVVRMSGAKGIGVPARIAGTSVVLELLSFVAVGGGFGFALIAAVGGQEQSRVFGHVAGLIAAGFGTAVLLLLCLDRQRCPERVRRALGFEGHGPLIPVSVPLLHALYWLTWLAHGLMLTSAAGASPRDAASVAGVFVLAPVLGFLALVAPAGAGVREAVMSVGLVPAVGAAPALSLVLLSRGVTLIADLVVWLALRPFRARG